MVDLEKAEKLPKDRRYFNISIIWIFYFRTAIKLFYALRVPHEVITLASMASGMVSAYFFYTGAFIAGAITLHLKDIFDACDGAIARLTGRGHLIGRYLDSVGDFFVLTAVMGAIALYANSNFSGIYLFWGGAAIISTFIQCSFFNYYQLAYVETFGIKTLSSKRDEIGRKDITYPDNYILRIILKILRLLYIIIYSWQDRLVRKVDKYLCSGANKLSNEQKYGNKKLMIMQSALCFGTHIFVILVFAIFGKPRYALIFIGTIMNIFLILLLFLRKQHYRIQSEDLAFDKI